MYYSKVLHTLIYTNIYLIHFEVFHFIFIRQHGEFCEYHVQAAYHSMRAQRMECQTGYGNSVMFIQHAFAIVL